MYKHNKNWINFWRLNGDTFTQICHYGCGHSWINPCSIDSAFDLIAIELYTVSTVSLRVALFHSTQSELASIISLHIALRSTYLPTYNIIRKINWHFQLMLPVQIALSYTIQCNDNDNLSFPFQSHQQYRIRAHKPPFHEISRTFLLALMSSVWGRYVSLHMQASNIVCVSWGWW